MEARILLECTTECVITPWILYPLHFVNIILAQNVTLQLVS